MKAFRIVILGLLPVIALALGFQIGASYEWHALENERQEIQQLYTLTGSGTVQGDPQEKVDIALLWGVWRLLQRHYIEPQKLQTDSMVFGAVSGLVDSVGDPYTVFMTPQDSKTFDDAMSGTLEGIGAQLEVQEKHIVVVSPIKGSPAEKAGLQSRDILLTVNGQDVEGMALDAAVSLIRGPKGTTVTLTVARPGARDPITIAVTRDAIHIPSVESSVLKKPAGSIGVVALNQFGDDSITEIKKAIANMPDNLKGFVLDLRFNGGGYLDGAEDLVSMFLKEGKVVTVVRRDASPEEHSVTGQTLLPDIPLVVLINGGSASASEITAGALKDNGRATLVGTQSFGKGTVQEIIDLPGGSSLRVTTAKWLTPSGHDLGHQGITPDIVVDRTAEEYRAGKDPQMDAAAAWLLEKRDVTKTATGSTK